ncbi:MAG TPA: hypothetical protein VEJ46_06710 [Candidatus Acidoferrum sp.]|nr:hypothetical protein [Candidatus Acidoferrum sp.]
MRGKDFNTGLRGVLFESRHYERMGAAIWLYGWLVLRQTRQQDSLGWVLGGSPVNYREIEEETGFNCRTLERWMQILRRERYIETETAPGGLIIRITKAKKFPQGPRGFAGGVRKAAEAATQNRAAVHAYPPGNEGIAERIGSSYVDGLEKKRNNRHLCGDFHSQTVSCGNSLSSQEPNNSPADRSPVPSDCGLQQAEDQAARQPTLSSDLRLLRQLLRAEREEAVRRELAVGTGPEVQRS